MAPFRLPHDHPRETQNPIEWAARFAPLSRDFVPWCFSDASTRPHPCSRPAMRPRNLYNFRHFFLALSALVQPLLTKTDDGIHDIVESSPVEAGRVNADHVPDTRIGVFGRRIAGCKKGKVPRLIDHVHFNLPGKPLDERCDIRLMRNSVIQ